MNEPRRDQKSLLTTVYTGKSLSTIRTTISLSQTKCNNLAIDPSIYRVPRFIPSLTALEDPGSGYEGIEKELYIPSRLTRSSRRIQMPTSKLYGQLDLLASFTSSITPRKNSGRLDREGISRRTRDTKIKSLVSWPRAACRTTPGLDPPRPGDKSHVSNAQYILET